MFSVPELSCKYYTGEFSLKLHGHWVCRSKHQTIFTEVNVEFVLTLNTKGYICVL